MSNHSPVTPVSTESEGERDLDSSMQAWKRIAKRVGFQKNWTKECIIKVLNDSDGNALQGKDLQRIPFNANRKEL